MIKKVQRRSLAGVGAVDLALLRCGLDTLKPGMTVEEKTRVVNRTGELEELFAPCIFLEETTSNSAEKDMLSTKRSNDDLPNGASLPFNPAQVQPDLNE